MYSPLINPATFISDTRAAIVKFLKESGCLWTWETSHRHIAQLASGRLSNYYVDCSPIFANVQLQDACAEALVYLSRLDEIISDNNWIIAASYGATGLAQSLARIPGFKAAYMEPDSSLGLKRFELGENAKVWLCDDVVTTCGTLFRAKEAILERFPDAEIQIPVVSYVDRRELGRLPKDKQDLRVVALMQPKARSWINQQSLPVHMEKCIPLTPHGNWRELDERIEE